jgi:exonuclease III
MSHTRTWKILNWNVRGINSDKKWNSIRDKILESGCEIVCIQETKREAFELNFIRKFCPPDFNSFQYLPSVGASRGILVAWKGHLFSGQLAFSNEFAISVDFTAKQNNEQWILTTVYAPCTLVGKRNFLEWFINVQMPPEIDWLTVGDFNLTRKLEDRNKGGADATEMFLFNEAISKLGLTELPHHGSQFTWTNKQFEPLMERLDWFFTSNSWTLKYPNSLVKTLVMETSDYWPCVIEINTPIPKARIFRFENHWLSNDQFIQAAVQGWEAPEALSDPARVALPNSKT